MGYRLKDGCRLGLSLVVEMVLSLLLFRLEENKLAHACTLRRTNSPFMWT